MATDADTIRSVLTGRLGTHEAVIQALDALDALVAALERGDSLLDQCGREHAAMFVRVEAAEAELAELRERHAHLESEWKYDSARGDHVVYRDEWEAFDRWQRGEGARLREALEAIVNPRVGPTGGLSRSHGGTGFPVEIARAALSKEDTDE